LEGSNEKTFYLDLLESQRKKYEEVRLKMFKDLDQTNSLKYFSELRAICDSHNGGGVKIEFALDLIEKIVSHDEKVVIFCFKLDPLYDLYNLLVKEYNKNFAYIFEGNLNSENRESILNKFKSDPNTKCLLCSGKIASEGLNLTEANNVIFLNEWWNPSTNNQARDRVLRIGQSKKVNIYNLRTKNTVEESLQFILDNKNQVNNEILEKMIRKEAMSTK
jgi:SNF2 family DNA or RNA helicase